MMFKKQTEDSMKELSDHIRQLKGIRFEVKEAEISLRGEAGEHDKPFEDKLELDLLFKVFGKLLAPGEVEIAATIYADDEQIKDGVNDPASDRAKAVQKNIAETHEWNNEPQICWGSGSFGRVIFKNGINLSLLCSEKELMTIQSILLAGIESKNSLPIISVRISHPDHVDSIRRTKDSFYDEELWKEGEFCIPGWSLRLSAKSSN